MKLNSKHKAFIEEYLINGRNGTKAYMSTYPAANPASANSSAAELLAKDSVKEYLKKKEADIVERYNITREKMAEKLLIVIQGCENDGDRRNLIKAVEVLNRMHGLDAAKKIEIDAKGIVINYIQPTNDGQSPGKKDIY